jgi:hypothetical protein
VQGNGGEIYWYKVVIPENVGNKWIAFSLSNNSDGSLYFKLFDAGREISGERVYSGDSFSITRRMDGAAGTSTEETLQAGKTYYLQVSSSGWPKGNYTVFVSSLSDDNWGTYEKAEKMNLNQWKRGKLEKSDDIDCYSITLPNDNRKHAFNISSDNETSVTFANGSGATLGSTTVEANKTNSNFTATGKGQTIYILLQSGNSNVTKATSYSIRVNTKKKTFSRLSLSKYKKGSKKIVGQTIGEANVKVSVNGKSYNVKSKKTGSFTVKLKKKLTSKTKIKVTVSKTDYKSKTKNFRVK